MSRSKSLGSGSRWPTGKPPERLADFSPELKRILREQGCRFERQGKGDHEIWFSPVSGRRFPVDSRIKSRHTANAVLKQAGLPKKF